MRLEVQSVLKAGNSLRDLPAFEVEAPQIIVHIRGFCQPSLPGQCLREIVHILNNELATAICLGHARLRHRRGQTPHITGNLGEYIVPGS
jgi:hypothetical protein